MPFVRHLGKTNMLTEIPQDINLELKDGVLTLKAGSKVYVPNGFEKLKKYYKDIVTTKYWKEITTGSREVEYRCYDMNDGSHNYIYTPDLVAVYGVYGSYPFPLVDSSSKLTFFGNLIRNASEESIEANYGRIVSNRDMWLSCSRSYENDLYKDTTTTTVVEGTPEDYTYTTEETETTEVGANDDWTRFEEIDTDVKRFDEVVIESDVIATNYTGYTITAFACYVPELNRVLLDTEYTGSGNGFEYNTEENYLRLTGSYTDATWTGKLTTLPLGLIEMTSSIGVTSIKQVFNGFGYIDSTVFVLPGVKGLIPDGWNADGSYKNIEFTVANMMVRTETSGDRDNQDLAISTSGIGMNNYTYNYDENYLYTGSLKHQDRFVIGKISTSSGKITSLTPKKVGEGIIKNKLYQLAAIKRTYYKYGTEPNVTVVGSPTIVDGVVSGFSSTNWLVLPENFSPNSNSWELVTKIHISSSTANGHLFNSSSLPYQPFHIAVRDDRSLAFVGYVNNTSTELFGARGTTVLEVGKDYYVKAAYSPETGYELSLSTDGVSYTSEATSSVVTPINSGYNVAIGADFTSDGKYYDAEFTGGSIDLTQSYIKINGKDWWRGTKVVETTSTDYDYYTDKLLSYKPLVGSKAAYWKYYLSERDTNTYTFTLDKDYTAKMLFVGNGGGGCTSQKDSRWHYSSGGSGACFEGLVKLPADTYTLTIGSLGYGNNADNTHYHSSSVVSTDSFLTNSAGEELIRVGAGGNGYTSVGGVGGAAGVLTLGTLDIIETKKATDGVYTAGNVSAGTVSAYDGTYSGYGAGTCGQRYQGNVYGIAGIFKLTLQTDNTDYDYVDIIVWGGTFKINTLPENANVTINGIRTNSVTLKRGSVVQWEVSLDGWTTQTGETIINIGNKEITVDLMKEFPAEPTYTTLLHAAGANASQSMTVEEEGWYRFHYYNTYGASDRWGYASIDGVTKYSWQSSQNSYTDPIYLEAGQVVRVWNNGNGYTLNTYFEQIT